MTEKIISLFFLLGSSTYLFFAQQLTFGAITSPKSGFLPVLAGITAVILALLLIINQLRTKKSASLETVDWTKFIFIIIGLIFYIILLNIIGYFIATFIFLLYLFKVADTTGWIFPFIIAISTSSSLYFLFERFLGITLP